MKLILARHGQTEENIKHICQGQSIGTLSENGKEQARKLGERLKNEKIDKIYVSDLKRTKDTAKEIIKHHPNAEVIYAPELRERCMGEYEGRTHDELRKAIHESGINWHEFTPKNAETEKELTQRVIKFVKEIIKKDNDKTALLITHGEPIIHILLYLFQKGWEEHTPYHHKNCALTILEINGEEKKVHVLNCCKHLTPE